MQRITFHHNYFYNVNSRLPSIRFGKAHIFNNYYKDCGTAVNTRMNACVQVEKNYFQDVGTGVGMLYSPIPGSVELIDNIFENTDYSESPTCQLDVPYSYSAFLDNAEDLPTLIPANIRMIDTDTTDINLSFGKYNYKFDCYPNPARGKVIITFELPANDYITVSLYDLMGHRIKVTEHKKFSAGKNKIELNTSDFDPGVYLLYMSSDKLVLTKRLIFL